MEVTENDCIIAVMGTTGVGKSTFVQHFTDVDVPVSDDLEAKTRYCEAYPCVMPSTAQKFVLVDTPGFDDTYRSDSDVLRELATFLAETYKNNTKLSGIVYLHRISDPRVGGTSLRNLRMFKRLVGEENLSSIVLATTFWDSIKRVEDGERFENELKTRPEFWGGMIARGSTVFRHDRGRESAEIILSRLLARAQRATYQIQHEMVDQAMSLEDTAAGREVHAELRNMRVQYEDELSKIRSQMAEDLVNQAKRHDEEMARLRQEYESRLLQLIADQERLHAKLQELLDDRERRQDEMESRFSSLQHQMQYLEGQGMEPERRRGRAQQRSVTVDHRWPTSSIEGRPLQSDPGG